MSKFRVAIRTLSLLILVAGFSSGCGWLKEDKCKDESRHSDWDWDDNISFIAATGTGCGSVNPNQPFKPEAPTINVGALIGHWHVSAQSYDDITTRQQVDLPADSAGRIFTKTDLGASSVELHLLKFTKDKIEICRGAVGAPPKCETQDYIVSGAVILAKQSTGKLYRVARQLDGELSLEDELGRGFRFNIVTPEKYLQLKDRISKTKWVYKSLSEKGNSLKIQANEITHVKAECFQWNNGGLIVDLRGLLNGGSFSQSLIIHSELQSRIGSADYSNLSLNLKRSTTPGGGSPLLGYYDLMIGNQYIKGAYTISQSGECRVRVNKNNKSIEGTIDCSGIISAEAEGAPSRYSGPLNAAWTCPITWL